MNKRLRYVSCVSCAFRAGPLDVFCISVCSISKLSSGYAVSLEGINSMLSHRLNRYRGLWERRGRPFASIILILTFLSRLLLLNL